jgi:hypothetical protein
MSHRAVDFFESSPIGAAGPEAIKEIKIPTLSQAPRQGWGTLSSRRYDATPIIVTFVGVGYSGWLGVSFFPSLYRKQPSCLLLRSLRGGSFWLPLPRLRWALLFLWVARQPRTRLLTSKRRLTDIHWKTFFGRERNALLRAIPPRRWPCQWVGLGRDAFASTGP